MENIELSFCIPTYNRAQSVLRLATEILSCEDPNIEVVVLDNGSTDDTLCILSTIKDKRLFVYSNGVNQGALFNMVNVLNKGRGKYLVYSTDQDYVDREKIAEFKSFLLHNSELACGYCDFYSTGEIDYEIFSIGGESIKNIAYKGRHPTGYFFNNNFLKQINIIKRFSDYEYVDLFPLEFIFAELSMMGQGAIYNRPIFTPETGEMVVKHKSSTTDGKSKRAFFAPEARLKLAVNYSNHLSTLELTEKEKIALAAGVFMNELTAATLGYRSILGNKALCTHYGMDYRYIKTNELFIIACKFYCLYMAKLKKDSGRDVAKLIKFNVYLAAIFFMKIIRRIIKIANPRLKFNIG